MCPCYLFNPFDNLYWCGHDKQTLTMANFNDHGKVATHQEITKFQVFIAAYTDF